MSDRRAETAAKHGDWLVMKSSRGRRRTQLRDTRVVTFGSPQAGTPVMLAAPLAALDLPLEVLVLADGPQTKVVYTAPVALAARYGLGDELAAKLAGIDAVTDAAIGP